VAQNLLSVYGSLLDEGIIEGALDLLDARLSDLAMARSGEQV
jgi:hypothetical protein